MEIKLYHTGPLELRCPDIYYGRKNADFGQGFYLTPDRDFALRWAGRNAVMNEYVFDDEGLTVRRFGRDAEWFRYLSENRRAKNIRDADAVIGPIANDTLFDTMGIITSGFLSEEEAMKLLLIGPEYTQVALKTPEAAEHLRWTGAEKVPPMDPAVRMREQEEYQKKFARVMEGF